MIEIHIKRVMNQYDVISLESISIQISIQHKIIDKRFIFIGRASELIFSRLLSYLYYF
jgi:hypothetical protein